MSSRIRSIQIAVVLCLPYSVVAGQTADSLPTRLPSVVTTATRSPASAADVTQSVQVIKRDDIARTGATDIIDVLKKLAGLDVIQYSGLLGGVGIRGFRPETGGINKHVLLLIDGRPAGVTNLALVDLSDVGQIEVLRGPASALYGSSGMGGVVNVVTPRSRGALKGSISALYGSFRTSDLSVRAGGVLGSRVDGDVSLRGFGQADNYKIGNGGPFRRLVGSPDAIRLPATGAADTVHDLGDGQMRDGTHYAYQSGAARVGVALARDSHLDVRGTLFSARNVEVPGDIFYGSAQNSRKNAGSRGIDASFTHAGTGINTLLRAYASSERSDFYNNTTPTRFVNFVSDNASSGAQLQATAGGASRAVTLGADVSQLEARSRRYSAPTTQIAPFSPNAGVLSTAAFVDGHARALDQRVLMSVGGRLDRVTSTLENTPFRTDVREGRETFLTFNPSIGLAVQLGAFRPHASMGRAFVAPDAFGRAGLVESAPNNGAVALTVGNHALDAEHSVTTDVGIDLLPGATGWDADLTLFDTRVSDRVTSAQASFPAARRPTLNDGNQVASVSTSSNATRATMRGLELRLAHQQPAPFNRNVGLRVFGTATRLLDAVELARSARIDTSKFAGRTGLAPTDFTDALIFGAEKRAAIKNTANLTATAGIEAAHSSGRILRFSARYVGHRRDSDFTAPLGATDIEYPPFMVADLMAGTPLTARLRAEVLVNNLTDENYYEKRGYNLAGRNVQLRLTSAF